MAAKLTIHEALIWVMVTAVVADRRVSDGELDELTRLTARLPVFDGFAGDVAEIVKACRDELADSDGVETIINTVAESLPQRLHETAYALAVDLVAVDLAASQEELVFLQMLEDRFELPKLAVAAIEHSARVRFRRV
jgi:hypothetical protein